jgi:cellulose synthase/poly-beta-1,6-N-acetylglucosamine synthase-like glycosyltransferase
MAGAMIWFLVLVFGVFLLFYRSMLVFFAKGWQKAVDAEGHEPRPELNEKLAWGSIHQAEEAQPWVTVLVAARNETQRMGPLLRALTEQQTDFVWELLWIDDQSTDESVEQARNFLTQFSKVPFRVLERDGTDGFPSHKKGAIAYGVQQARSRWVLVTDADCVPGPEWIRTMIAKAKSREDLVFVAGPVRLSPANTLWERSQALEFMSLNAIAASTLAQGRPVISNGGNMAFDRQAFLETAPYDSNWKHPGGDDDLLMHQFSRLRGSSALTFCLDRRAMVDTPPLGSFRDFLAQRIRWISKQGAYPDSVVARILKGVWFMHAFLLGTLVVGVLHGHEGLVAMALGTWGLKTSMDGHYTRTVAGFYQRSAHWGLLLWTQLWYLPYTLGAGLAGYRGKFTWKGRNYG